MTQNVRVLIAALLCSIFLAGQVLADVKKNNTPKPDADSVRQALNSKLITGMLISGLKLDGSRANIMGTSPSNANVSQFLRNITESANFSRVELVSISQQGGTMQFLITADIQCPMQSIAKGDNLCAKPVAKSGTVFKCGMAGKIVFQDRPCAK